MQEEIFLSRWNRTQVCGEGKGRDTLMLEAIFLSSLTLPTCRATTRWCERLLQGGGGRERKVLCGKRVGGCNGSNLGRECQIPEPHVGQSGVKWRNYNRMGWGVHANKIGCYCCCGYPISCASPPAKFPSAVLTFFFMHMSPFDSMTATPALS